jgi:LmbE family N-acetylglucosaminyl deacetylase
MWSERASMARAFLRAANGLGSLGVEELWAWAIGVAGTLLPRRPVSRWGSSGSERVVVIAPHPDDEAMGCAGTLVRHHQRGDSVRIVFITDGSQSRALGLDSASMRTHREKEATEAASRMGADYQWSGLREGDWSDQEGHAAIRRAFVEVDPTVVYAPSSIDYHPEHRRVARTLAAILAEWSPAPEVRIYAVQVPLTPLLTNLIHDVSDLEAAIRSVLVCYPTQRESVMLTLRLRRYAARFWGAASQVEGFCSMPAGMYASLLERPPTRFRPLWIRAWTDPLALIVGLGERRSWSKFASRAGVLRSAAPRR